MNSMNPTRSLFFKAICLLFFLVCLAPSAKAQTQKETASFEIVVLGLKIGSLTAQKTGGADSVLYSVDSRVKFWFFGDVDLKFLTRSHFKAGKIIKTLFGVKDQPWFF
jgi:hypothetical protein